MHSWPCAGKCMGQLWTKCSGPMLVTHVWANYGHIVLALFWPTMSRPIIDTVLWPCAGQPCLGQLWTHCSGPVLATHVWASCGHTVLALCWRPMSGPAMDILFWPFTGSAQCGPLQLAHAWSLYVSASGKPTWRQISR